MAGKGKSKSGRRFEEVLIDEIALNPDNPRSLDTDSKSFRDLAESVKSQGVIVPVHVRLWALGDGRKYMLLAGERRTAAAAEAGLEKIPAIVHEKISEEEAFEITFTENFSREDLNAVEEAKAAVILLNRYNRDIKAVAAKLGRSEKWVRMRQKLHYGLCDEFKQIIVSGDEDFDHWNTGMWLALARYPAELQRAWYADGPWIDDIRTAADVEDSISCFLRELSNAPWDLEDDELLPDAPACSECTNRSGYEPMLFADDDGQQGADRCFDEDCFNRKRRAFLKQCEEKLRSKHGDGLVYINTEWSGSGREVRAAEEHLEVISLGRREYEDCKKKDSGSVPAMVVDGKEAGKIKYVRLKKEVAASIGKHKKEPKTDEQRRDELNRKRWSVVLSLLLNALSEAQLDDLICDDPLHALTVMVCVFGTCRSWMAREEEEYDNTTLFAEYESIMEKTGGPEARYIQERLLRMVTPKIREVVAYDGPVTQVPDYLIEYGESVIRLFGIKKDDLWAAACEKYPEPKCLKGKK